MSKKRSAAAMVTTTEEPNKKLPSLLARTIQRKTATRKFLAIFPPKDRWNAITPQMQTDIRTQLSNYVSYLTDVEFGATVHGTDDTVMVMLLKFNCIDSSRALITYKDGTNVLGKCVPLLLREIDQYPGSFEILFKNACLSISPIDDDGFELFDVCIERGVSIDVELNERGVTALILWASSFPNAGFVCQKFLERGANIDQVDKAGRTIATRCILETNAHLLSHLFDKGWLSNVDLTTPRLQSGTGITESDMELAERTPTVPGVDKVKAAEVVAILRDACTIRKTVIRPMIKDWLVDDSVTPLIPDLADLVMQYVH